mmetsp:Transcript_14067/g.14120  ORF Transcript_14067/g.14120 Transcript_14067/m.14120 type:complete len:244 (+) Transcript_14067:2479-3210(+)
MTLGGASPSTTYHASSSAMNFKGAFIFAQFSTTFTIADATSTTLAISKVLPPSRVKSSSTLSNIPVNLFIASNTVDNCLYTGSLSNYNLQVASLSEPTFTPTTVSLKGPDSVDTTITISFSTVNPISAGGSITITLAQSWDLTYATFSATGLSNQSSSKTLLLTYTSSSRTLVITQFAALNSAASITISVKHVFPPTSGTDAIYYITSIYTQDADSNYYIDSLSTFTAKCTLTAVADAGTTSN